MILSPTGWNAVFKPYRVEPVVGWDSDGYPLIVDAATGRRIRARELTNHDLENFEATDRPFIGVLPGNGWTIHWADGEADAVVAFAVQHDGYALPILARSGSHGSPYYAEDGDPVATLRPPRAAS